MTKLAALSAPALIAVGAALLAACGYHVGGRADLMPKTMKSIAIEPFGNGTTRYELARRLPEDLTREFHSRTKYLILTDAAQADAVLSGSLVTFNPYPTVSDPKSNRATAIQIEVTVNVSLRDRRTGAVLFAANGVRFRERYEVALDPNQYFDESGPAMIRLSQDVARDVVSSILEKF